MTAITTYNVTKAMTSQHMTRAGSMRVPFRPSCISISFRVVAQIVLAWYWSQFILECGLRMSRDDSDHDIQGDKGNDQPTDDQGGLHEGALQSLTV